MRKGSIVDIFYALTILFIISICIIIYAFFNGVIMGAFVTSFGNNTAMNTSLQKVQTSTINFYNSFNYGFLFIYFIMLISIASLDYFVYTHPIFLPLTIIIQVVSIFFSMILANAYWYFINASPLFQVIANQFFIVTFMMKNLPFFDVIYCGVVDLVMYMTKRGQPRY
jgi:hypothetical protein